MLAQPAPNQLARNKNVNFSTGLSSNKQNTQNKSVDHQFGLEKYCEYLQSSGSSEATIRNYRSDIGQFLQFIAENDSSQANDTQVANEKTGLAGGLADEKQREKIVEKFASNQKKNGLAEATVRRKVVSVSQYLNWVFADDHSTNQVINSGQTNSQPSDQVGNQTTPTNSGSAPTNPVIDDYLIRVGIEKILNKYLAVLQYNSAADATIRNYRSDIKQFAYFIRAKNITALLTLDNLKRFALAQKQKGLKATSIQRKLVSITQFATWAQRQKLASGVMADWPSLALDSIFSPTGDNLPVLTPPGQEDDVKLEKKRRKRDGLLAGIVLLLLLFGSSIGLYLVQTVQDLRQQASTGTTVTDSTITTSLSQTDYNTLISEIEGRHIIPFSGKLYQADSGEQVVGEAIAYFRLFNSPKEDAEMVWESGACQIKADPQGIFQITLGGGSGDGTDNDNNCGYPLDNDTFYGNSNLWLSPIINNEQLALYPIKTVKYSQDSELLTGAPLGNPVINDSVLYMNDQGEILFADAPTLNVVDGSLTLAGDNLYFVTEGQGGALFDSFIAAPQAVFGGTKNSPLTLVSGSESSAPILSWRDSSQNILGVIDSAGKIGIGTTNPLGLLGLGNSGAYLDVSGDNLIFYDAATGTTKTLTELAAGGVDTNFWTQSGTAISYAGGNVGIATGTTEQALTVGGNIQLGIADGDRYIYFDNGTSSNSGIRYNATNDKIQFSHDGSTWSDLGTSGVTSVTNSNGTLTISPTTGAVVASLNLNNANTWTATQTFAALTASGTITLTGLEAGTDNTVLILNSSNQVVTDEIDARVWGSSLVDGSGTTDYVAYWSDADTLTSEQYLSVTRGGLGGDVTALGAGELLYSTGTTSYDSLAAGAASQLLISGGAGAPSWSNIASLLTAGDDIDITGTTNATITLEDDIDLTSLRASSASGLSIYDDGTNLAIFVADSGSVGIGTASPEELLTVGGNLQLGTTDATRYIYFDNGTANNSGFRYNSTSDVMEYSDDGVTWVSFTSLGSTSFFTNTNSAVTSGSYLEVSHNQNTVNLLTTAWIHNGTNWVEIDDMGRISHNIYDPNLVAWYKTEEASGDLDNAEGTSSRDLIDKGAPTYAQAGKINDAISLDGTDDFFCTGSGTTCADNDDFDFGTASFTIGGWFKHDTIVTDPDYMMVKYSSDVSGGYKLYMNPAGNFVFGIDDDATSFPADSATSASDAYDDNGWHHVVAVKKGTEYIQLFVDGKEVAGDYSLTATGALANAEPFYLGVDADASSNPWAGLFDEPFVYSRALSPGEVEELYQANTSFKIEIVDSNIARLYNNSGDTANLKLNVVTDVNTEGPLNYWNLSGSDINYVAGNVGIGTASPNDLLELLSTTDVQLRLAYDTSNYHTLQVASDGGLSWLALGTDADLNFNFSGATDGDFSINTDDFFVDTSTGYVGIGNTSPGTQLDVSGAIRSNDQLISTVAIGTSPLAVTSTTKVTNLNADRLDDLSSADFLRSNDTDNYTSGTLTFNAGTSVDINSTTLTIADTDIALDGASTNLDATGDFSINTDDFFVDKTTGYVGINTTTNALYLLDVNGVARIGNTVHESNRIEINDTGSGNRYAYIDFHSDDTNTDYGFRIIRNNSVNATTSLLNAGTGNILVRADTTGGVSLTSGATSWVSASDIRLKENIQPLDNVLEKIRQIQPIKYNFIDNENNLTEIGVIAQEIQPHFPEVVFTDDNGYLSVAYDRLGAISFRAIQEQQLQIEDLQQIYLDDTGSVVLTKDGDTYTAYDTATSKSLTGVAGFLDAVIANLRVGSLKTQELIADSITIAGQSLRDYIQNIVDQTIASLPENSLGGNSELLSPLPGDDLTIKLDETIEGDASTLQITNQEDETVLTIDNQGNLSTLGKISAESIEATGSSRLNDLLIAGEATVSGTLTANEINAEQFNATSSRLAYLEGQIAQFEEVKARTLQVTEATVSGTLYAESINNFDQLVASAFEEPSLLNTILGNIDETEPFNGFDLDTASAEALNLTLADLNLDVKDIAINASALFINDYFKVNGSGYIAGSLGIGQNLVVGDGIQIGNGAIAYRPSVIDENTVFYIQPERTGTLSLFGNLMTLTADGRVTINGDLRVAGDVDIAGETKVGTSLLTNLLKPLDPDQPFQIQLANDATESGQVNNSRFEIVDELGTPVATISATGQANFSDGVGVDTGNIETTSPGVFVTTKTAGKAYLPAGLTQVVIRSEKITDKTLIYVTPLGSTNNQTLYIKQQTAEDPLTLTKEGNFVISLDFPLTQTVEFNWWMVQ